MHNLQKWMDDHGETDESLAKKLSVSRPQVHRIRRGLTGASKKTALELEQLTGIAWHEFIEPDVAVSDRPASQAAQ